MKETSFAWRKSSYSGHHSACVEVAPARPAESDAVLVRDSKDPASPVLEFAPGHWQALMASVRHGDYDSLD
jgi:hypothetical protein